MNLQTKILSSICIILTLVILGLLIWLVVKNKDKFTIQRNALPKDQLDDTSRSR